MSKLTGIAIALTAAALLFVGVAEAQYPPPVGNLQAIAGSSLVPVGGSTTITGVASTNNGQGIANVDLTATIENDDDGDSAIGSKTITKKTDANGRAYFNFYAGTRPGIISILMTSSNGLSARVLVTVQGSATTFFSPQVTQASVVIPQSSTTLPSTASAAAGPSGGLPPAAPIDLGGAGIRPPSTGNGGLADAGSGNGALPLVAIAVVASVFATAGIRFRRTNGC